jgi:iron-sulfur cluster insertion protein
MSQNSNINDVTITDAAFRKANELYLEDGMILRIEVLGGGCSGFEYNYSTTQDFEHDDVFFEQNGSKIAIDSISLSMIKGSTIDFIEDMSGSRFMITNPNVTMRCGCGNSFSI